MKSDTFTWHTTIGGIEVCYFSSISLSIMAEIELRDEI